MTKVAQPVNRTQWIDHMLCYHGAMVKGSNNIREWAQHDIKYVHMDDHAAAGTMRAYKRVQPHEHV